MWGFYSQHPEKLSDIMKQLIRVCTHGYPLTWYCRSFAFHLQDSVFTLAPLLDDLEEDDGVNIPNCKEYHSYHSLPNIGTMLLPLSLST